MTRRNRKKLTRRTKVLITVVIIAICLFVIHRFDFLTKSEVSKTTTVSFVEYGTEKKKNTDLEIFEDETGNSYIVLPESVNGFVAQKYYIKSEQLIDSIDTSLEENENINNTVENTVNDIENSTENNTVNSMDNAVNSTVNNITNNIENDVTEKNENLSINNTISNNTVSNTNNINDSNNSNSTQQNTLDSNNSNFEETEKTDDVDLFYDKSIGENEVNNSEDTLNIDNNEKNINDSEEQKDKSVINENNQNEESQEQIVSNANEDNNLQSNENQNTNTINSNIANNEATNTEIENNEITTDNLENSNETDSNTQTNLEESINNNSEETNELETEEITNNNTQPTEEETSKEEQTGVNQDEVQTDSEELATLEELTDSITEYMPGEKVYFNISDMENNSVTIEVEYQVVETNGKKLYNQELVSNTNDAEVRLKCYIPEGFYLNVKEEDKENIKQLMSGVEEFERSTTLLAYDITITNGTEIFEPKDYNQIATVTIKSTTALKEGENKNLGLVHIKESDAEIQFEKTDITEKTSESVEFITNEFSPYVLLAYEPIQTNSVTIDDYESDYNYYIGKNYTDGMAGTNQKKYTDDNLAKVNINYYSYDYSKGLEITQEADTINVTNYNWVYKSVSSSLLSYIRYDVQITITSADISKRKEWTMTFQNPGKKYDVTINANNTLSNNSTKISDILVSTENIEIIVNDFSAWTKNGNSYTTTIGFYVDYGYGSQYPAAFQTVTNFSFSSTIHVGHVSNTERQVLFSYVKCIPINSGKISFELIDNPYMDRPPGYGFDGWTTNESGYTFACDSKTRVQTLTTSTNGSKEITINLYANWKKANVVFISSSGNSSNDGLTPKTPKNTTSAVASLLSSKYKTATNASNRELNIIVFMAGSTGIQSYIDTGKAFTLTSLYDGIDYRSTATVSVSGYSYDLANDVELSYLKITGGNYYKYYAGTDLASRYVSCESHNFRIGRGIITAGTNTDTTATFYQIYGHGVTVSSNTNKKYRLVIESGKYGNIQLGRPQNSSSSNSYTYVITASLTLGNDFDRVANKNDTMRVHSKITSRTGLATTQTYVSGKPAYTIIVKSGKIGIDNYNLKSTDYQYSGIYVGGHGYAMNDKSERHLIVEGGEIANIIGGLGIREDNTSRPNTCIYVKGGNIQNIVGGAGLSMTYGDRMVQVTGGSVAYNVFGGSNSFSTDGSTDDNKGQVSGRSLVYIGGNAIIGTQPTSSSLYNVNAGSVYGAGNGRAGVSTSGTMDTSHVIIDGNCQINNSVYGGGNYGRIIGKSGVDPSVKIDILGGTIEKDVFGGSNQNNITGNVNITIQAGTIKGCVYGGSNSSGTISKNTNITVKGGTIGVSGTSADRLFGGGMGQSTVVTGNATVNITDEVSSSNIYGSIYGGSSLGKVTGNSNVNVKDYLSGTNTINITSNIFGGGKGSSSVATSIGGNSNVTIDGGTYVNVFGGCNTNGTISGAIAVKVGQNYSTTVSKVFGGGNNAVITSATNNVYVYLYKNANVTNAFNGGNNVGINESNSTLPRKIYVQGATVGNVFGGSYNNGELKETFVDCSNNSTINNVFGGGYGSSTVISGNTNINVQNCTITGYIFGGGDSGKVTGTTNIYVLNSSVPTYSVYGGGNKADVGGNTNVTVESSTIGNVYGGGNEGIVSGNSFINISNSSNIIGMVYGGGNKAEFQGKTNITMENSSANNVFGGGNEGIVSGDTLINILSSSNIKSSIYGGGNNADVEGNTSVALEESTSGNVYGGGNAGNVNGTGKVGTDNVFSSTVVSVLGSTVTGNIFGGGNKGEVTGNTNVIVSDLILADSTIKATTVGNSIFGGGNAANVNGTTVNILNKTQTKNVYGGGNLGEVNTTTNLTIDDSTVTNNVYGGGSGTTSSTDGNPGQVIGNITLDIRNGSNIQNNVFGGGQGVTAIANGNIIITLKESSNIGNDIYGGGDNGPINGATNVYITSSNVGGSAYAAGNGTSAIVKQNSYILAEGNTQIGKSIFGGGNAAETGESSSNILAIVDISGATIGENVYGGANSSVINGNTITNIGIKAINDYYGEDKEYEIGKIDIQGTIYGGGEQMDPTKEFNYDTISVTGTTLINVDGQGYETSSEDTNTIDISESIFASGNASRANTDGNINIRNYGTRDNPKRGVSIQRATTVLVDNSALLLNGTTDSTSLHPEGLFTLNRIAELKVKNNSTLYLVNGANLLGSYYSLLGEDGAEEYATVNIVDTAIGEDGKTYEVINGKIYNNSGDIKYYVESGVIYEPSNDTAKEDEVITNVANTNYATTIERNVDNRIYMYSGRNLNISNAEDVSSKYGEVKGMTFFGIFKSSSEGTDESGNNVFMGMYDPNYQVGEDVTWNERDFNRSYVLGLHQKSPEQDITKDGFYTVYEELNVQLDSNDILTEENYNATSYVSYITPTPKDDVYYMWYAGPDDEVYYYTFNLTASKHSTFGTKELMLLGISYENAILTMSSVDAALNEGVGLYDKNTIPNINTDQEAANKNIGLSMKTGNTGWSMIGSTDFYADPITADNNTNNATFDGTTEYKIENLKTTPIFSFYLYHSNNITESGELGTYQINMNLSYWKDALNRGNARVVIDVVLLAEVFDDVGYNGAITPGSQYDLFTNTVTNVTTKSSFSTYFELAQPNFMEVENVSKYYEDSYRVITTGEYVFPVDTTITMIDRWNKNNPSYYYYSVTQEDVDNNKTEYKFSEFKSMGSSNEPYNEKEARKNYRINISGIDYEYENFIFIVNFENAKFTDITEGQTLITKDQLFRIFLKADVEETGRTEVLFGLLDDQIDSIMYGIYDTESTINIGAELSKNRIFLGNELSLDVDTIYDVKKGEQSVTIYDTRYFDKKLGIKLTFYKKNDAGEYEAVNGANLLGTYFELNGEKYYPRADGTTRIKIAELVSNASSTIRIGTENSSLSTGEYRILVESFGSADGIYYGVEASDSTTVNLEIINDLYGLNSTLPEEQVIIDKETGHTLDKDTGYISEDGNNTLNFKLEYLSGLNNPYITVSLYRRDYDETMNNPYENTYSLVDLSQYVNETLELPVEINQEYTSSDEEFIQSIKQFENEYKAIDTETIKQIVTDNTVSVTFNINYTLKEFLKSGTYKVEFKLYDATRGTVNKQETDSNGQITEKPFDVTQYEYLGETFSYIIIK